MSVTADSERRAFLGEITKVTGLSEQTPAVRECFIIYFSEDREISPREFASKSGYSVDTINAYLKRIYKEFCQEGENPLCCPGLEGKKRQKYLKLRHWLDEQFREWCKDPDKWNALSKSASKSVRSNYLDLVKEYGLPTKTYENLLGREADLQNIIKRINKPGHPFLIVYGLGGTGKTSLVTEVVYQYAHAAKYKLSTFPHFDKIIWTSAQKQKMAPTGKVLNIKYARPHDSLNRIISEIGRVCGDQRFSQISNDQDDHRVVNYAIELLEKHKTLLVIDNCESISQKEREDIFSFINEVPATTKVILTTRYPDSSYGAVKLSGLSSEAASKILDEQIIKHQIKINNTEKSELLQFSGGIPAAIIVAAWLLACNQSIEKVKQALLTGKYTQFYFQEATDQLDYDSFQLLLGATFFQYPTSINSIAYVAGIKDEDRIDRGIEKLRRYSFLEVDSYGRYCIPNLIREYAVTLFDRDVNIKSAVNYTSASA